MGAALAALAIVAPWLVWLPALQAPAPTVFAGALAIGCALHGWGRLVARLAGRDDVEPALALQWGVAAVLAIAGIMLAFGIYDARLLLVVGAVAHSADLAQRFAHVREAIAGALTWQRARFWLVPLGFVAVVALANVLGTAGQVTARAFDDETHILAQVERLATTGSLADPFGFSRDKQLGGYLTLSGLASAFGDAQLARILDRGVALVLFLLLLCSRLRLRDATSALWASLLVVFAASFTLKTYDLMPLWIPAGLILGLHVTVATSPTSGPRALVPIGLVAGALWTVRCELAPIGLAMVALVWWCDRAQRRDWRRIAVLVGVVAISVIGYEIARRTSLASIDGAARALLAGKAWPLAVRLPLFAILVCAVAPLFVLAARELDDRALRWLAIASGAGAAGIASRLTGSPPSSIHLAWPMVMGGGASIAIVLARETTLRRAAMVIAAFAALLVYEARSETRRRAWSWVYYELAFDVQHARDLAPAARVYHDVQARVPAGEPLAVWVSQPERLDYARNPIFDVRTPAVGKRRHHEALVRATRARWLLVDRLSAKLFANLVAGSRVVATGAEVQLIELP